MKSADDIRRYFQKSTLSTNREKHEAIFEKIQRAQEKSEATAPVLSGLNLRSKIMRSPIAKIATAAVVIITALIGIYRITAPSIAWADVAEKLDKIHSYIYRQRESKTSGPQKEGFEFIGQDTEQIIYNSANYGKRTDSYKGGQLIFSIYTLPRENALINILHYSKEYIRYPLSNGPVGLTDLQIREVVKSLLSNDYVELGSDTIDGIHVEGAELKGQKISGPLLDDAVTRLWVDVETGLPVRIELEGLSHGTSTNVMIVQDEFQWNVKLLASDFEPNIPPGYKVVEQELPSGPKPEETYAAEENGQELDLPDLGDLNLLGLDDDEPEVIIPLVGMNEIWRAQDDIVSTWPDYSDVREQLYEELLEKLDLSNLSDEQLFATAVALREKFWEAGGCLSKISYPYGYAARILLESIHNKHPEDMTITDELVETIQSVELAWNYEVNSDEIFRNTALRDELIELRKEQYEQVKRELAEGREPVWEDFVRVNDLAILFGRAGDFESALDAAVWLIKEAERGGWTAYMEPLKNMQSHFNEGGRFNYNISIASKVDFPEEFRYGRRLPSFKGPKKRGTVPAHLLEKNPSWH